MSPHNFRRVPSFALGAAAVVLLLWCLPLAAQYTTASLGGNVLDPAGAAVPDAAVTVQNTETGFAQAAASDATGAFVFPRLPVGRYRLRVEKSGFAPYTQDGIRLTVGQAANQTVVLKVGGVTESVTVAADAELVTTRTATAGQLVDQRRIADLPLNGRQAQALVYLAAGTVDTTGRYCGVGCFGGVYPGEQQAAVNGTGPAQVNYQLDGAGHNDTFLNMNLPFPNPDSIQEFNLDSHNLSAQYGSAAGGVVNIVTKSGTNELHGTLFEFLRNGKLNARNFFAAKQDTLKRNQFGGSAGGPIRKDRLFFFGTYQGTRTRSAAQGRISFVPTQAERNGDFSALLPKVQLKDPVTGEPFPNNQVPVSRFGNVSKRFLEYIPVPNAAGREVRYAGPAARPNDDQYMAKIDYNAGSQQISGRYFDTKYSRNPTIFKENLLQANGGEEVHIRNAAVNHTFTARPSLLFNTWFGWNTQKGGSLSGARFGFPDMGVKIAQPADQPKESYLVVGGAFGADTSWAGNFDRGDSTFRENITVLKGAHELHVGTEAVRLNKHFVNTYRMGGFFYFDRNLSGDNIADFLLGRVSRFEQGGGEFTDLAGWRWTAFIQDNWRVNQRLSLNLGLRWDPLLPYQEAEGRVTCFQPGVKSLRYPNAPAGLTVGGKNPDPGCPETGVNRRLANFAPRFGFAYRLTRDGKTSIRGGAGYYYTALTSNTFTMQTNTPFSPQFFLTGVDFEDPYGSAGVPNPFPAQYAYKLPASDVQIVRPAGIGLTVPSDLRMPLIASWNLFVERQLLADFLLRVGYAGNKGTYLGGSDNFKGRRELNPAIYVPGASTVANTQSRRIYSEFSSISIVNSGHNSNYNALQVSVEKRFSRGLSILSNYTWSKTIDDFGWTNSFDRSFDRGISDDDVAHVFKFSGIWQLPRTKWSGVAGGILDGWELTSNVNWRGGFPITVRSGRDNSFTGVGRDRADFLGGDPRLSGDRPHGEMILKYFDTSKFVQNAVGTFGNSGKNILRGPRAFNTDLGLLKTTPVSERASLQFRAEFFNFFNNVNFNPPGNSVSTTSFGRITGAGSPRIIQFALKLAF